MLKKNAKLYFAGLIFFVLLFTLSSVGAQQAAPHGRRIAYGSNRNGTFDPKLDRQRRKFNRSQSRRSMFKAFLTWPDAFKSVFSNCERIPNSLAQTSESFGETTGR